jgi:predicted RNA binding protein YcfA (HicA-like mRNA interferase family)
MRRDRPFAQTIVPVHAKVKPHILAEIISQAGITLEDFLAEL